MDEELKHIGKILSEAKTIAVVGLSKNPNKTSRGIADFLVNKGYKVVGVNPNFGDGDAGGIKVYQQLTDIPFQIDIVNVFRRSEDIPGIINDVIAIHPKVLWLQLGIQNDKAVKPVIDTGITVIQDKCIMVYHNLIKQFQN
jgi:hypothetical protein